MSYVKLARYERAVYPLTRCTQLMPQNEKYFLERGKVYQALQMFEAAINDYTELLKVNPNHAQALFRRAFAYKAMKKYEEAIVDFEKAKVIDPENAQFNIDHRYLRNVNYLKTAQNARVKLRPRSK